MKRVIVSALMVLLAISFATAKTSVMPITEDDLPYLPGQWTGHSIHGRRIDLKIYNERLPAQGEIEVYFSDDETQTCSFDDGYLENGQLCISCEEIVLILRLRLQKSNGEVNLVGDVPTRFPTNKRLYLVSGTLSKIINCLSHLRSRQRPPLLFSRSHHH
jgi:hypothetical protein